MAHVLGRPYANILAKFAHVSKQEERIPATDSFGFGWTGDVKYHLGAEQMLGEGAAVDLKVLLAPNPSHLDLSIQSLRE